MRFEWNKAKNTENFRKHGISFSDVLEMFERPMLIEVDNRSDYGEERFVGTGFLDNGVAVVVWTERQNDVIRIISVRRANKNERKRLERYLSY